MKEGVYIFYGAVEKDGNREILEINKLETG